MFEIIFIIFIVYLIAKKNAENNPVGVKALLDKALKNQQFYNTKTIFSTSTYSLITADTHGENYLFALLNNNFISTGVLTDIYEKSKKEHIHNIVIITPQNLTPSNPITKKIKEYSFEVWNIAKLISLSKNSNNTTITKSVLRTSDTSLDKCAIDNSPVDPIQHGSSKSHSILTNPFRKPNRL